MDRGVIDRWAHTRGMNSNETLKQLDNREQYQYLNTLIHDEFEASILAGSEEEDYDSWMDFFLDCVGLMIPQQRNGR